MNRTHHIVMTGILMLIAAAVLNTLISGECFFWIFVISAIVTMLKLGRIMGGH